MPRYMVINPNGDPVFNHDSQDHFFKSRKACHCSIIEELEEPVSEDSEGRIYTMKEDTGWKPQDYRIFVEVD